MKNNDLLNTREARAAREDAELEELLKERDAAINPEKEENKEGFANNTSKDNDGVDWATRYSNLRSYSQKKENELNKRISELERKMNSPSVPPTDPAEFEAWANEFPDAVRMFKTLVHKETNSADGSEIQNLREEINNLRYELTREKAFAQLTEKHSDWRNIVGDNDFHIWLDDQKATRGRVGQAMWDAINTDDFDISAAANVLSEYKQLKKKNEPRKTQDRSPAAFATPHSRTTAPVVQEGKRTFTEDEIESMSQREYEKLEDEITLALKEGRVLRRVGGALM